MNKVKTKKLNAGNYEATVISPTGEIKKVQLNYWRGPGMKYWGFGKVSHDLFESKKETILALEEVSFEDISE